MNVMLDLRKKTLKGEAVKARLKAAATPTASFLGAFDPSAIPFPAVHSPPATPPRNGSKQQKSRKQKNSGTKGSRARSRKNSNANKQPPQSPSSPKRQQRQQQVTAAALPPPPQLQEETHFPALATPSVAVDNIVDKVQGSVVTKQTTADGASTATTTSSTTSSTYAPAPPAAGGYAAALLKAAPPKVETKSNGTRTTPTKVRHIFAIDVRYVVLPKPASWSGHEDSTLFCSTTHSFMLICGCKYCIRTV